MNDEAKKFRSKYFFIPTRRTTLPQDVVDMMNKKENKIREIIEKRETIDSNNKEDKKLEKNQR